MELRIGERRDVLGKRPATLDGQEAVVGVQAAPGQGYQADHQRPASSSPGKSGSIRRRSSGMVRVTAARILTAHRRSARTGQSRTRATVSIVRRRPGCACSAPRDYRGVVGIPCHHHAFVDLAEPGSRVGTWTAAVGPQSRPTW